MQEVFNPTGLQGIEFVEFAGKDPVALEDTFLGFGFSKVKKLHGKNVSYFNQNDIHILLNSEKEGYAAEFTQAHGPCICSMGWRVKNADAAFQAAVSRGARAYEGNGKTLDLPAIYGIGDSLIYFVDTYNEDNNLYGRFFEAHEQPIIVEEKGFLTIDHLTNNVFKGAMEKWADFYKKVFGFTEIRYFDIKGQKTGLHSYALKSPCGGFSIPLNEGTEAKSQIEEYLREYHGEGIQHLAFLTRDLLNSLDRMENSPVDMLDIADDYYDHVFDRVPDVTEDHAHIQRHNVLVDGDKDGYLLQIFTKNMCGPIFIELIQRKNHYSFGEGNFQALFNSIERDQERRGTL